MSKEQTILLLCVAVFFWTISKTQFYASIYVLSAGVNISFYSQILHLGKLSIFMEFWEEFPFFGIGAIFRSELEIQNEKPFPIGHFS
jgi:hypothetical protein